MSLQRSRKQSIDPLEPRRRGESVTSSSCATTAPTSASSPTTSGRKERWRGFPRPVNRRGRRRGDRYFAGGLRYCGGIGLSGRGLPIHRHDPPARTVVQ